MTGQLIFRDGGKHRGKRILMVTGVVAVNDDSPIRGEHQYTIVGEELVGHMAIQGPAIDRTQELYGYGFGCPVTLPIWRV